MSLLQLQSASMGLFMQVLAAVPGGHDAAKAVGPKQLYCLSEAVYRESRGEPYVGRSAVAHVVLNRVRDGDFGSSICEVLRQPGQFPWAASRSLAKHSPAEWRESVAAAVDAATGRSPDPTAGATYFFAHDQVRPSWAWTFLPSSRYGVHTFCAKDTGTPPRRAVRDVLQARGDLSAEDTIRLLDRHGYDTSEAKLRAARAYGRWLAANSPRALSVAPPGRAARPEAGLAAGLLPQSVAPGLGAIADRASAVMDRLAPEAAPQQVAERP